MLKRLEDILKRYNELSEQMADNDVIADSALWTKIAKEHSDISEVAQKYLEYKDVENQMNDSFAMAEIEEDAEMRDMLTQEGYSCKERLAAIKDELKIMLLPKDKDDDKNVIMEIRGGVGGEEAALFAYELYRMYINYCERHRFRIEEIDKNATELGGIKEVTLSISGKGAYSRLKYESGGHRVQRVPETESQGRVHTSACTVAVLPEAEEVDVELNEKDIRLDTYRSSGAGGQHINKTDSAIRLTHIPTGIVVTCQDERSQLKNKEKAYKLLRSRLYDFYNTQKQDEYAQNRKSLIGSGDRSERIRTYNFPQSRVTDHRIGLSLYDLDSFLMGDLDQMIDALQVADREAQLAGSDDIE